MLLWIEEETELVGAVELEVELEVEIELAPTRLLYICRRDDPPHLKS